MASAIPSGHSSGSRSYSLTIVFGFLVLAEERLLAKKGMFWLGVALW